MKPDWLLSQPHHGSDLLDTNSRPLTRPQLDAYCLRLEICVKLINACMGANCGSELWTVEMHGNVEVLRV